jgi:hypothetical protein
MAKEKFIHGKVDSAKHDGKASNVRRLQAVEYHQEHWREELIEMEEGQHNSRVIFQHDDAKIKSCELKKN